MTGTGVASETADVAYLSNDLSKLPHLLHISQKAIRTIRQNLIFAPGAFIRAICLTIPMIHSRVTGALLQDSLQYR